MKRSKFAVKSALLFALVLVLALAACSSGDEDTTTATTTQPVQQPAAPAPAEAPATVITSTGRPIEAAAAAPATGSSAQSAPVEAKVKRVIFGTPWVADERARAAASTHGLAMTAVSDAHHALELGRTYTEMPEFDGSPAGFLAALKEASLHPSPPPWWGQVLMHGVTTFNKGLRRVAPWTRQG